MNVPGGQRQIGRLGTPRRTLSNQVQRAGDSTRAPGRRAARAFSVASPSVVPAAGIGLRKSARPPRGRTGPPAPPTRRASRRWWPAPRLRDFYASWRIPTEENPAGFNCTRVNDPEIDEWLRTAGSTTDVAVRQEAYCNIATKLYNDIVNEWVIGLGNVFGAGANRLQGWQLNEAYMPYAIFGWDAENWYVTE